MTHLQPPASSLQPFDSKKTIGILGSGQLGLFMALAAQKMNYHVVVYDVVADGPAAAVADEMIVAAFDDQEALRRFALLVDVVTLEFENIPATTLDYLERLRPVHPSPAVVRICQDRVLEKDFLKTNHFPTAPYQVITSAASLDQALCDFASPCILKTATLGYDGKGQCSLQPGDDVIAAWASLKTTKAILEKKIDFLAEGSLIVARSTTGEIASFPPQENSHRNGILDYSIIPPHFEKQIFQKVELLGSAIVKALEVVGLLTIEFFVLHDGSLLVNELAPRPHNSGHHTLESSRTSQFEQAIAAVTGLPLGSPELLSSAVMVNLLGDLWNTGEPDWSALLADPHATLHLYGKKEAKPGRKMGHFTVTAPDREEAIAIAERLLNGLKKNERNSQGWKR